jgi:plasmid stabilization system protein ParE
MPGGKRIITFAASAFDDLEGIRVWYREQQVPDVGNKLLGEIVAQVERLADFPESGRIVPEFGIANLREIIHPPLRIIYRLDGHKIRIIRVGRSERLIKIP